MHVLYFLVIISLNVLTNVQRSVINCVMSYNQPIPAVSSRHVQRNQQFDQGADHHGVLPRDIQRTA